MAASTFEVKHSTVINAPAPTVQLLIDDFHGWPKCGRPGRTSTRR